MVVGIVVDAAEKYDAKDPNEDVIDQPSCTNFTSGEFGPTDITSEEDCTAACVATENLPVGNYNGEESEGWSACYCTSENNGEVVGEDFDEDQSLCETGSYSVATDDAINAGDAGRESDGSGVPAFSSPINGIVIVSIISIIANKLS